MALALGVECLDEIGERSRRSSTSGSRTACSASWRCCRSSPRWPSSRPRRSRQAAVSELVIREQDVDLAQFPVPVCWPEDGGPYITLPGVITHDRRPRPQRRDVSHPGDRPARAGDALAASQGRGGALARDGGARREDARGDRAGGDPASIYAASAPLPPTIDEFLFAGFLRREPVRLAKAVTSDLEVPRKRRSCSRATSIRARSWCSRVRSAITPASTRWPTTIPRCTSPRSHCAPSRLWPHTIVGRPPMEDYWLGHATERIFLPLLKLTLPRSSTCTCRPRDLSQPRLREHRQAVSGAGL